MGFHNFKVILCQSSTLFGINNQLSKSAALTLTRYYAMDPDKKRQKVERKKEEKEAKKLAARASEPEYFQKRSKKFTELREKFEKEVAAIERETIKISLPDGKVVEGFNWDITPLKIAHTISGKLATEAIVAKVNNELWDMERELEFECEIELLKFDEAEAKATFWKSAACILGEALERLYGKDAGALLCNIDSTPAGFFADIHLKDKTICKNNIAEIEGEISKVLSKPRNKFERIVASKNDAQELFKYNQFKLPLINDHPLEKIPIYRCGSFVEMSNAPMIRNSKKINAIKILEVESVVLNEEPVQRVHGIAFSSSDELDDFLDTKK